jgi:hypothetical protein
MSPQESLVTRRDFLRGVGYAALASTVGLAEGCRPAADGSESEPAAEADRLRAAEGAERRPAGAIARVVLIRDADAVDAHGRVNAEAVQRMLDQAVAQLLQVDRAETAWKQLVQPTDRVGLKSNVWNPLPTPPEVEEAIKTSLMAAGLPAENIRVDDRGARQTLADCTALINVRPLRTHHWAGIGGCLKNYIMFVPTPSAYHPDSCADLGAIWKLPIVRGKTRLNLLVVLTPQFHGRGPHHFDPRYVWPYKGLLVSQDPVAVDAVGVKLLEVKRRLHFGEDVPFPTRTKHVTVADVKHGIGVSDLERIELVKLGWTEEVLI